MVIKVQVNWQQHRYLVYDKTKEYMHEGELSPDIATLMGRRDKAFFHARYANKQLRIDREAGWQDW